MTTSHATLLPKKPFDFDKSLRFLAGFSPMHGEQSVDQGAITKAMRVLRTTVGFKVAESNGALDLELTSEARGAPLDPAIAKAAIERVRFFLSLDDDLAPFYSQAEKDAAMKPIVKEWFGFHQVKLFAPFESACWAILAQRCPQPVARKMKDRLVARFGGAIEIEGRTYRAFPEAADLEDVSAKDIEEAVGHAVKARRIRGIAEAFLAVDEAFLARGEIGAVADWLGSIEGIGPWSKAFILLRGLGRTERLEGAEPMLLEWAQSIYGRAAMKDVAAFRRTAARYGSQQGYWSLYFSAGARITSARSSAPRSARRDSPGCPS